MAGDVKQRIVFEIEGDDAQRVVDKLNKSLGNYDNKADKADRTTRNLDNGLGKMSKSMYVANLAADATTKALSFLSNQFMKAAEAAAENEKTNNNLKTAMMLAGNQSAVLFEKLNRQASILETVTGTSDEVIRKMQATAINYGFAAEKSSAYAQAAVVVANITGKDVNTAFEQLTKSISGVIDDTLRYIPEVSKLTKEQLAQDGAVKTVLERYGAFTDLATTGTFGALTQLKNAFDSVNEQLFISVFGAKSSEGAIRSLTTVVNTLGTGLVVVIEAVRTGLTSLMIPIMHFIDKAATVKAVAEQFATLEKAWANFTAPGVAPDGSDTSKGLAEILAQLQDGGSNAPRVGVAGASRGGAGGGVMDFSGTSAMTPIDTGLEVIDFGAGKKTMQDFYDDLSKESFGLDNSSLEKTLEERNQMIMDYNQEVVAGFQVISGAISGELINVLEGGEFAFDRFFSGLISSLGRYMVTRGTAYMLEGIALSILNPGQGVPLIAAGGAMLAFGAPLVAAGAAMSPGQPAAGGAAGAGAGGAPNPGGFSGPRRNEFERERGPETIIINVEGAVTEAEVGVKVRKALEAARREGV